MLIFIFSVSVLLFNMCSNKTKGTVIKTDTVEEEMVYNNNPECESDTDESAEDEGNVEEDKEDTDDSGLNDDDVEEDTEESDNDDD